MDVSGHAGSLDSVFISHDVVIIKFCQIDVKITAFEAVRSARTTPDSFDHFPG